MKLKTSYFNTTAFRKNLTRFLPLWGIYTVILLLVLIQLCDTDHRYLGQTIAETLPIFPLTNLAYGFLCAVVLFGDLFNSRLCNALHAMPLRREGWFLTNISAGALFSLAPTMLCAVICTLLLFNNPLSGACAMPWLVALVANAQFLFFFGLAVLCVFCTGNRIAALLVYGLLNFGAVLVYWAVDTLYAPLLEGVVILQTLYNPFSPVIPLVQSEYFGFAWEYNKDYVVISGNYLFQEGWGYLGICAAIGAGLLGISLLLYRRRKLEYAGDFMAIKALEPVFLLIYAIAMGCIFQMVDSVFGYGSNISFLLFVGMAVGWFTGKMLLSRSVRVFGKKSLAGCIALLLAMGLSLGLTMLDPLGLETWVPEAEQVQSVTLSGYRYSEEGITLTEQEDIENILQAHRQALEECESDEVKSIPYEDGYGYSIPVTLTYTCANGKVAQRTYSVLTHRDCAQLLKPYFSSPAYLFGVDVDAQTLAQMIGEIYLDESYLDPESIRTLAEALLMDCRELTLAQNSGYHPNAPAVCWLSFELRDADAEPMSPSRYCSLDIFEDSVHTMKWLEDQGYFENNRESKYFY